MDPEIKNLWLEKLREPGRVQGKGLLRNEKGEQCCLDVLCEVAVEKGVVPPPELGPVVAGNAWKYGVYNEYLTLPQEVQDWLGIEYDVPFIPTPAGLNGGEDGEVSLAELNDSYGWTFAQIADVIEEYL